MTNLDNYTKEIEKFIQTSINRFRSENGPPNSIGIYCCPWAGWLTTHFNLNKTLKETQNNCPDFEFVEYDLLELSAWQDEHEFEFSQNLTGDNLNEIIFNFLKPIVRMLKDKSNSTFLLQMLDSNCAEVI